MGGQKISCKGGGGGQQVERTLHETMSFLWDISFRIYKDISIGSCSLHIIHGALQSGINSQD